MEQREKARWLCIFDVNNIQEAYARCLETINWLEQIDLAHPCEEDGAVPFPFRIAFAPKDGRVNSNQILRIERIIQNGPGNAIAQILQKSRLLQGLRQKDYIPGFSYYFRIHMSSRTDVVDLQYLILLFQSHPDIVYRSAVRLMEDDAEGIWHDKDYFRAAHFLQFIYPNYPIFYAYWNGTLKSLDATGSTGVQTTFLPLLLINEDLHREFRLRYRLKYHLQELGFRELHKAFSLDGTGATSLTTELFQIGLRMLLNSLDGNRYRTKKAKEGLLRLICRLTDEVSGISPLDMILFGALSDDKLFNQEFVYIKHFYSEVQQLSEAVFQITENALHHSERKTGVFCFRLQHNQEYLENHYPGYHVSDEEHYIELLISDANSRDNIISNFLKGNKAAPGLKHLENQISLANFFDIYENKETERGWRQARRDRSEFCHGLLTFARIGYRAESVICVRSCEDSLNTPRTNYFYYTPENGASTENRTDTYWIPGTQYAFLAGKHNFHKLASALPDDEAIASTFDFSHSVYATTYSELSSALRIGELYIIPAEELEDQLIRLEGLPEVGQERKDAASAKWKQWFDAQYEKAAASSQSSQLPLHFDLEPFCQTNMPFESNIEMFCKGFLSSRFFAQDQDKLYILLTNVSAYFSRLFFLTLQVMAPSLNLKNVCVYFYPSPDNHMIAPYFGANIYSLMNALGYRDISDEEKFPRTFPRDLFYTNEDGYTLFEQEMLRQAKHSLTDRNQQGFQVQNTHMRLGNKVHIDTFYEMTLFFENPNYAYYTAFLFARALLKKGVLQNVSNVLFYGYSSYSRGILWALIQILREYYSGGSISPNMEFIIYQNDLQIESNQLDAQMYYSDLKWQSDHSTIWEPSETALVQIVPISSSLTTFKKMQAKLNEETGKEFTPKVNYTAFWVRDQYEKKGKPFCDPTEEEKSFWKKAVQDEKQILSSLIEGDIYYLVYATSMWNNPLRCPKCFPGDPILEYPLVETDPTSTIPTQQLYLEPTENEPADVKQTSVNDQRIARIHNHLLYGHIARGKNHYQYYIRTKRYFQNEHEEIRRWLEDLRYQHERTNETLFEKCVNILVIPKQSSNVEFGQYVYEYFFRGEAENIIINTEKEFRSNFKTEYNGLFLRLKEQLRRGYQIKFHYLDTAISSGTTFSRAATLISTSFSEITSEIVPKGRPFEKVFLLISRLSGDSKHNYVRDPKDNFHAYAELHISSIRTFGDSCVPCRLQQEAVTYYQNAATKSVSAYWEGKSQSRAYEHFDAVKRERTSDSANSEEGYQRMICSHRMNDYIRPVRGKTVSHYFDAIRNFFEEMSSVLDDSEGKPDIYYYLTPETLLDWISAGMKVVSRPFFSFDYRVRCAVMDIFLLLSEYFMKYRGPGKAGDNAFLQEVTRRIEISGTDKTYLLQEGRIEWVYKFAGIIEHKIGDDEVAILSFVRKNFLKGLADLKSNYILRADTIKAVFSKLSVLQENPNQRVAFDIMEFCESYVRSILRVIHSSSDETRSVWLEHLLQNGVEYGTESDTGETLFSAMPQNVIDCFKQSRDLLLIENNRSLYQSISEIDKALVQYSRKMCKQELARPDLLDSDECIEVIAQLLSEYHMRNVGQYLAFSPHTFGESPAKQLYGLWRVYHLLTPNCEKPADSTEIAVRYNNLRRVLEDIVPVAEGEAECLVLFEKWSDISQEPSVSGFPPYCIISPQPSQTPAQANRLTENLERLRAFEASWVGPLNKHGYYLFQVDKSSHMYHVLLALDNNYGALHDLPNQQYHTQKIAQVYIYIAHGFTQEEAIGLIRTILMFRSKLVKWLENDFNNDTIVSLFQHKYLASLLSADKVVDHQEKDFISCLQYLLTTAENTPDGSGAYCVEGYMQDDTGFLPNKTLKLEELNKAYAWYLLCSYVNARISRLFRMYIRAANNFEKAGFDIINNYYARDYQQAWMQPADNLRDVFFKPIVFGHSRLQYLSLLLEVVAFYVEGEADYLDGSGKKLNSIPERLDRLVELLGRYHCVTLKQDERSYAFLSEHLVSILLDSCISALKASEEWNMTIWESDAFSSMLKRPPEEKCRIDIYSSPGTDEYSYLVLKNQSVSCTRYKAEPGLSQAAIRWYIESLWRFYKGEEGFNRDSRKYRTEFYLDDTNYYITKLPILMP